MPTNPDYLYSIHRAHMMKGEKGFLEIFSVFYMMPEAYVNMYTHTHINTQHRHTHPQTHSQTPINKTKFRNSPLDKKC